MVTIEFLARRQDLLPTVRSWFEAEWPEYYGKGGKGSAVTDLVAYSHSSALPLGLIAFLSGEACGFAALKSEPFPSHPHLGPWAGAAVVVPALRRQGIGDLLFASLEEHARAMGHNWLYCATATSASLLVRRGWRLLEHVEHEGQEVGVYDKVL